MKNAFIRGAIIGVVSTAVLLESDINYKGMLKKGKKMMKRKMDDMMDR